MDTQVKAVVDALINNDYQSMKRIFDKNEVNEDVYGLMLLESADDKKLQAVFTLEAIKAVNDIIRRLHNFTVQEIDLSDFYPEIIEGREYPANALDGLKTIRDNHLASIRAKLNIQQSYELTRNEAIFIRYLSQHKPDNCPIEFPFESVTVEYCREPFKYQEVAWRGYGNNRYCKFVIDDGRVLIHTATIQIIYPDDSLISESLTRQEMLKLIGNKANKTLIMEEEMNKKLEIETLYNKMTDLYKEIETLNTAVADKKAELQEIESKITEKSNSLDDLIQQATALDAYISELNEKKATLAEISNKESEIKKIDELTDELTKKDARYQRLLKISEKIDYYEKNAKELQLMRRSYNNMRDIAIRLHNGEESLARRIADFTATMNRKNDEFEKEMKQKRMEFEKEVSTRTASIEKRENDYADLKAQMELENNKWRDALRLQYQKEIDAYPILSERVEALKTENKQLAEDKKIFEEKATKLENALEVLKSSWR